MLEIGYARALRKPVLLLTDAPDTLPFDLGTQRAAIYKAQAVGGGELRRELVSLAAQGSSHDARASSSCRASTGLLFRYTSVLVGC